MVESDNHAAFAQALRRMEGHGPIAVPHVVQGREYHDGQSITRFNPCSLKQEISRCHEAPAELVIQAVQASRRAQREWRKVPLRERAAVMRKALGAFDGWVPDWAVRVALEIGKPHVAARLEAVEVRDILDRYLGFIEASGAFEDELDTAAAGRPVSQSLLRPYGVFGVITPFNYPIVQAAGPTIGALLAGNGVVIKTSHLAPWSGQAVYEMCAAMNLPVGLVNVVHGADDAGRHVVASDVDGISFTGSVAAGRSILRAMNEGPYPRPVIAEMGGKNPVIVTDTADLAQAAKGIAFSAFDLAGQKCSALSRVLVSEKVHDSLVAQILDCAAAMHVGPPSDQRSDLGPVVDEDAKARFHAAVARARKEKFAVSADKAIQGDGHFVAPVITSKVPAMHELAMTEHFVPFLTVSPFSTFEEALSLANATPMGLTAGLYSGDRGEMTSFVDGIEAGCINVNVPGHATTGWWPAQQTFGGWKASGTTGKHTLGKWYVQQFARQQSRKVPQALAEALTC